MTRQQAKQIALSMCSPIKERTHDAVAAMTMQLQASYAANFESVMLETLRDILRRTPGAVVTRVHDTFIIETQSEPQARQIEIDMRVTPHGAFIEPLKILPLVRLS
ncbi:MAG: hypothetical protein ACOYB3_01160 [Azonexus sp.]